MKFPCPNCKEMQLIHEDVTHEGMQKTRSHCLTCGYMTYPYVAYSFLDIDRTVRETDLVVEDDFHLILFDVDGTLVRPKSGGDFRKTADDSELLPGRLEKIQALKEQGMKICLVTNQGGVAFGYFEATAINDALEALRAEIGADSFYACFSHPKAKIERYRLETDMRKPGPGMLNAAMKQFKEWPAHTLMIGDRPEDEEAARAAHCGFQWADDFFR